MTKGTNYLKKEVGKTYLRKVDKLSSKGRKEMKMLGWGSGEGREEGSYLIA